VIVLFAPLRIISLAFVNMTQPELAKLMRLGETRRVWAQAKIWSVVHGARRPGLWLRHPVRPADDQIPGSPGCLGRLHRAFVTVNFIPIMLYIMPRIVLEIPANFRIVALSPWAARSSGWR